MNDILRVKLLKIALSVAFLIGLCLSSRLWISTRFYPLMPVFGFLPKIPKPFDIILFSITLLLLVFVAVSNSNLTKVAIRSLVAIFLIFFLTDQSRLQPWVYQYFMMIFTLSFLSWSLEEDTKINNVLNTLRTILILIYFWAGVQKLNPHFNYIIFPPFLSGIFSVISPPSFFAGFTEIAIAVGLLFKKTRNIALFIAISLWFYLLLTLGPLGQFTNSVVWPWNIAMAVFTFALFYKLDKTLFKQILWVKNFPFQKIVLILLGIMPIFSFFNLWDSYLSMSLYSGNFKHFSVIISPKIEYQLPLQVQRYIYNGRVRVLDWSLGEMNVPHYPEDRTIKNIGKYFCAFAENPDDVKIRLWQDDSLANYDYSLNCLDLQKK